MTRKLHTEPLGPDISTRKSYKRFFGVEPPPGETPEERDRHFFSRMRPPQHLDFWWCGPCKVKVPAGKPCPECYEPDEEPTLPAATAAKTWPPPEDDES